MAKSILQTGKYCIYSGETQNLHKHHIFGASSRKISDANGFWVWLTQEQHQRLHANPNKGLDLELKIECQEKYLLQGGTMEWWMDPINIGRNYFDS